ncbi:hypothetical protein B0O99DRAFT_650032 [Bisporella sp. PMI_857]|nr:hypothetical protein B0O99DRAFT_650032 [Bisporella sp. PMI_857]
MIFVEVTGKDRDDIAETGSGGDIIWYPDVQVFTTWNKGNDEFLGYLYLDLHPRQGKSGHAANFNPQPINYYGALKGRFWMLFYELEHGIHDLVANTKYARYHGTITVQDFCEAPNQTLKNWCWTALSLKALIQHYSTLLPEYFQIPDVMIKNLIQTKEANNAIFYLRQLYAGIFDMIIHQPDSCSQVYALDVFYTVFKSDPMNASEGFGYRRMILEKGGSQNEMKMLPEYLGRVPSTYALY